jgi:hypothetical protein
MLCKINGAALGTVQFSYVVWQAEDGSINTDHPTIDDEVFIGWWNTDFIGFIFEHPRRLMVPIPVIGRLGIYTLSEEVEAHITQQLLKNP